MSQPFRLDNEGLINRDKKISFIFNGIVNILVMRAIH
jgi:hypothetical protein